MRSAAPIACCRLFSPLPAGPPPAPELLVRRITFNSVNPALNITPNDSVTVTIKGGQAEIAVSKPAFEGTELYWLPLEMQISASPSRHGNRRVREAGAGIAFWADSFASFYTFEITPEGMFSVAMLYLVSGVPSPLDCKPSHRSGHGKDEYLRVLTKEAPPHFFNDQQVGSFDGAPAGADGRLRRIRLRRVNRHVTFGFTNFTVAIP